MSGFEIVGAVLGAIPILLKAVEGIGTASQASRLFFKKKLYVKKLANALYEHNLHLTGTIKLLLSRIGYDEHSSADGNLQALWQNKDIRDQIQECLSQENYTVFMDTLEDSARTIGNMAKNLEGLVPSMNTPTGNLYAIIEASKAPQDKSVFPRLKFVFQASSMEKTIKELDATSVRLERFVRLITTDNSTARSNTSPKATRIAKGLLRIRDCARNLHSAIKHGWSDGCHHPEHDARFILDDQLDSRVVSPKPVGASKQDHLLEFRVAFISNAFDIQPNGCETSVMVMKEEEKDDFDASQFDLPATFARVTFNTPAQPAKQNRITSVDNICITIAAANTALSNTLSFVLTNEPRLGIIESNQRVFLPQPHHDRIALGDLLDTIDTRSNPMPLKIRMMLALKLASNLPQLSRTPWLRAGWSSDLICFPLRSEPAGDICSRIDFDRPFVSSPFKAGTNVHPPQDRVTPESAFLDLGIVLLELWHHKSISAQFPSIIIPDDFDSRMMLASKWRKESSNSPMEYFDQAVRYCIFGVSASATPIPSWDDKQLWSTFCGEVIEPLYQNCKTWR